MKVRLDILIALALVGVSFGMFAGNPWLGVGASSAAYLLMPQP